MLILCDYRLSSVGMSNPEVMVVLGDGGKPVTVIRALDDDDDVISRDQRSLSAKSSSVGARVSAEVKKNSANRYNVPSSFIIVIIIIIINRWGLRSRLCLFDYSLPLSVFANEVMFLS